MDENAFTAVVENYRRTGNDYRHMLTQKTLVGAVLVDKTNFSLTDNSSALQIKKQDAKDIFTSFKASLSDLSTVTSLHEQGVPFFHVHI